MADKVYSFHVIEHLNHTKLYEMGKRIEEFYASYGIECRVVDLRKAYEGSLICIEPAIGVKVSEFKRHKEDLQLHLAAKDIEMYVPYEGTSSIGILIKEEFDPVEKLSYLAKDSDYLESEGIGTFFLGFTNKGILEITSIEKLNHLIVSGTTGSGKSSYLDLMITAMIYRDHPEPPAMVFIDSIQNRFSRYDRLPNTIYYGKNDRNSLEILEKLLRGYYKEVVVFIDDYANFRETLGEQVDTVVSKLVRDGREIGVHLIISVQRPSVNILPGEIKAAIPNRIAFRVAASVDSVTIIGEKGAEVLGIGEFLFKYSGMGIMKYHAPLLSDRDINDLIYSKESKDENNTYARLDSKTEYNQEESPTQDELLVRAGLIIVQSEWASIGNLQRYFKIGFNRAARIMDQLCDYGIVGPENGTKPRAVISMEELVKIDPWSDTPEAKEFIKNFDKKQSTNELIEKVEKSNKEKNNISDNEIKKMYAWIAVILGWGFIVISIMGFVGSLFLKTDDQTIKTSLGLLIAGLISIWLGRYFIKNDITK